MSNGRIILDKILTIFLVLVVILIGFIFIREEILKSSNKKFYNEIKSLLEEEQMDLFVYMDSKIYLRIKNNKVLNHKCLDEKCNALLKEMGYTNKNIDGDVSDFINNMKKYAIKLGYKFSRIDIASSNTKVEIISTKVADSKYTYLDNTEIDKIIDEYKLEKVNNEELNEKLLNKFKQDTDYSKSYSCIIDNNEVKCYVTNYMENILKNIDKQSYLKKRYNEIYNMSIKFKRILNKFDFKYKSSGFGINTITLGNDIVYDYTTYYNLEILNNSNEVVNRKNLYNVLYKEDEILYLNEFSKVNLLSKTINSDDVIVSD